jgi:hypothetical protein
MAARRRWQKDGLVDRQRSSTADFSLHKDLAKFGGLHSMSSAMRCTNLPIDASEPDRTDQTAAWS